MQTSGPWGVLERLITLLAGWPFTRLPTIDSRCSFLGFDLKLLLPADIVMDIGIVFVSYTWP